MSGLLPPPGTPRYDLDSRIATGGMGEVWRATDALLEREVAVKILKAEYADDPLFRTRFETEARHAAALDHPNVASVFDYGELPPADGSRTPRPFLVMELVPGQPLSALLRGGEPMPPDTAAGLVAQAADAVAAAHALDIVHRDIKPANLLVTPDGTVKITDFGIARAADGAALTATGQIVGTPQYLSPEQAEGLPATTASDIYALGVVLYEALAGRRPFDGDSPVTIALKHLREEPPALDDNVPSHLREVVAAALAKDPGARIVSAAAFARALRGGPVDVPAAAPVEPSAEPSETPPVSAGAVPGAGAAVAAAATAGHDADASGEPATAVLSTPPGPGGRRGRFPGWLPWAGAAVGVLLVVGLFAALSGGDQGGASASLSSLSPSASSSPTDDRVRVRRDDYVGMKAADAKRRLQDKGLEVTESTRRNPGGHPAGTVADLTPVGLVSPGGTVTLQVWGPAPKPTTNPKPAPAHHGKAGPAHKHGEKKGKKK